MPVSRGAIACGLDFRRHINIIHAEKLFSGKRPRQRSACVGRWKDQPPHTKTRNSGSDSSCDVSSERDTSSTGSSRVAVRKRSKLNGSAPLGTTGGAGGGGGGGGGGRGGGAAMAGGVCACAGIDAAASSRRCRRGGSRRCEKPVLLLK